MLPRVIIHNVVSADGRMDWFTPDIALYYELAARWRADAMLAGSETILTSEEQSQGGVEEGIEVPDKGNDTSLPWLVVPDSRGRIRTWSRLRMEPYWRDVIVLCSRSTPAEYVEYLGRLQIEHIVAGEERVDLGEALEELNSRYGVESVRVDSGGTLNGLLLRAGLVDEVSLLISPSLEGGTTPSSIFRAPDLTSPEGVIDLRPVHVERLRNDVVWLRYEVVRGGRIDAD